MAALFDNLFSSFRSSSRIASITRISLRGKNAFYIGFCQTLCGCPGGGLASHRLYIRPS